MNNIYTISSINYIMLKGKHSERYQLADIHTERRHGDGLARFRKPRRVRKLILRIDILAEKKRDRQLYKVKNNESKSAAVIVKKSAYAELSQKLHWREGNGNI